MTHTLAYLAQAEYQADGDHKSFTLEIFFRAPDRYMLRGRGALGVTGFSARIEGDSLVLLLNREHRGFQGRIESYPDSGVAELWRLLQVGLPWLTGQVDLRRQEEGSWRVRLTERGSRPVRLALDQDARHFEFDFGRYRRLYPFWHLYEVRATAPAGWLTLTLRQRLHNPDLDSTLFILELPPDTRPLFD